MKNNPAWILIRGLTRGQGHWADFLPMFLAKAGADNVECLDIPGNGERFKEKSLTSTAEIARDLRSKSRFIREGRKVHLVGHSLGGMVAVEWVTQFPQDAEKLVLINTSASNTGAPWSRFSMDMMKIVPRLLRTSDPFEKERLILGVIANDQARVKTLLPELSKYTASHPVRSMNALRQLIGASRTKFPENKPPVPVQILASPKDRLVSASNSRQLASRWGVEPQIHPSAGHDIGVDDPQWLVEQLL